MITYDSFREIIDREGGDRVLRTVELLLSVSDIYVLRVFSPLVERVLTTPSRLSKGGVFISGYPSSLRGEFCDILLTDLHSGRVVPPGEVSFTELVNLPVDGVWISGRGTVPASADFVIWLSVHKHSLRGEGEDDRRRKLEGPDSKTKEQRETPYPQDSVLYGGACVTGREKKMEERKQGGENTP